MLQLCTYQCKAPIPAPGIGWGFATVGVAKDAPPRPKFLDNPPQPPYYFPSVCTLGEEQFKNYDVKLSLRWVRIPAEKKREQGPIQLLVMAGSSIRSMGQDSGVNRHPNPPPIAWEGE